MSYGGVTAPSRLCNLSTVSKTKNGISENTDLHELSYHLDQKLCLLAAIIGQKGGNLRKLRWQLYHMLRFGSKKKSSEQCWHINNLFYKIKLRWQLYHTRKMMGTGR